MNTPQREEGGRGRRRRRRGPPPNSRNDSDQSNPQSHRPSRRPQSYQSRSYRNTKRDSHSEQSQNASASERRRRSESSDAVDPRPPTQKNANVGTKDQSVPKSKPKSTPEKTAEQIEAERIQKEQQEKQEREEAERKALIEAQNAKRKSERELNLLFGESVRTGSARKERPSDTELRQLDSSLKKCTGFLRKIRFSGVTVESAKTLCNEARTLNLSRYVSEVVAAISESKLRSGDIEYIILLCGEMHRRYEDFIPQLVNSLSIVITNASGNGAARDLSTRKAAMRLIVEMFVLGMISDVNPITSVLKQLMKASKESIDSALPSLSILAAFVRCANRTLLPPHPVSSKSPSESEKPESLQSAAWEDTVLSESAKSNISSALESFFTSDVDRIVKEAANSLRKAKDAYHRAVQLRGSPEEASSNAYEAAKQVFEKILSSANVLAESLGKASIDTPSENSRSVVTSGERSGGQDAAHIIVSNPFNSLGKNRQSAHDVDMMMHADHPFEGDQQRIFYTELLSAQNVSTNSRDYSKESPSSGREDTSQPNDAKGNHKSSSASSKGDSRDSKSSNPGSEGRRRGSEKPLSIDKLLSRLTGTETKEDADNFVRQFLASTDGLKNGTKRLGKALLSVSAQKLNVLPAYSRIAATLQPIYPDMVTLVSTGLEEEFRNLVGKPDADEKNLSTCNKSSNYVGEFIKFGLIPKTTMFDLLALCMKDLSGHRVDLACHLLETCGRYVYLSPSTHIKMSNILETLWRLKSVRNLEARHNALIETAFFAVRLSPGSKAHKKKSRPPLHEYIRHLIYYRLDSTNISWTHSQLLKLHWTDELECYVAKKFVKISRARFSTIPYVAALIGSLQKDKPSLVVAIIDSLLESIRAGMEKNDGRESQRRLAEVHLLGEMHTCGIVDERIVYNILYQFITLGHESGDLNQGKGRVISSENTTDSDPNPNEPSKIAKNGTFTGAPDPAGDFFRIRLACSLLESCGRVLAVANRRKLEVFWLFLERYMFCKTYQAGQGDCLPLHISHVVGDVFENLMHRSKRIGKDARVRSIHPNERKLYHSSNKSVEGFSPRGLKRSNSLEEAIQAVMVVERSPADVALIAIPYRRIEIPGDRKQNINTGGRLPRSLSTTLSNPAPGSGIIGNVRDGFVTTNMRKKDVGVERTPNGSVTDEPSCTDSVSDERASHATNEEDDSVFDEDVYEGDVTAESGDEYAESLGEGTVGDDEVADRDEDDSDEEHSDDDSISYERQRPRTEEEDAFAKELAAFTAAAVQSARASNSRVRKFDRMAIPMALMTQKMEEEKAAAAAAAAGAANTANHENSSAEDDDEISRVKKKASRRRESVEFKMLVRKGGKSQLQGLQVPASSTLAVKAKESETAGAARSEETKRLVLGSTIVLNDDSDDLDEEVPLRFQQDAREKEKSIRQQRVDDEQELLSTLFKARPRR